MQSSAKGNTMLDLKPIHEDEKDDHQRDDDDELTSHQNTFGGSKKFDLDLDQMQMPDVSILDQTDEVDQMMKDAASSQGDAEDREKDMRDMTPIIVDKIDSIQSGRNTPGFNNREDADEEDKDENVDVKDSHERRMDQIFELAKEDDDDDNDEEQ